MDGKRVIIVTPTERAVSVGKLRLSEDSPADASPRLNLQFETEAMCCIMRIPADRVEHLAGTWDGEMYRYMLPSSEQIWLPPEPPAKDPETPSAPVIETYPLPISAGRAPMSTAALAQTDPKPRKLADHPSG